MSTPSRDTIGAILTGLKTAATIALRNQISEDEYVALARDAYRKKAIDEADRAYEEADRAARSREPHGGSL